MANKRLREILTAFSAVGWSNLKDRKKPLDEKKAPKQLREAFEFCKNWSNFVHSQ